MFIQHRGKSLFMFVFYHFHRVFIECTEVINMNSFEITAGITALANALACRLSVDEITLAAALLVQLGDTLATIATHRSICDEAADPDTTLLA